MLPGRGGHGYVGRLFEEKLNAEECNHEPCL